MAAGTVAQAFPIQLSNSEEQDTPLHSRGTIGGRVMPKTFSLERRGRREDQVPADTREPPREKGAREREDRRWRRNHAGLPCAVV
jgi:hypothetical protein